SKRCTRSASDGRATTRIRRARCSAIEPSAPLATSGSGSNLERLGGEPTQSEGSRYQTLVRPCPWSRVRTPRVLGHASRGMTRAWVLLPSRAPFGIPLDATPEASDALPPLRDDHATARRSRARNDTHTSTPAPAAAPTAAAATPARFGGTASAMRERKRTG